MHDACKVRLDILKHDNGWPRRRTLQYMVDLEEETQLQRPLRFGHAASVRRRGIKMETDGNNNGARLDAPLSLASTDEEADGGLSRGLGCWTPFPPVILLDGDVLDVGLRAMSG